MKPIWLGLLLFFIGGATAMGINQATNQPIAEPIITIAKKISQTEPTGFSLENAPSESIKGLITDMSGAVWRQSRTATEAARLNGPVELQQGEVIIASDEGKLTAGFNPAVTLTLFPETKVEIVQTLPVNLVFNHQQGVGQYLVTGANPVTIRSLNLIANIDEGLFVIDTDLETGAILLSLKTGSAKVGYNSPEWESKVWELSPGDVFDFDSNERRGYFK